MFKKFWEDFKAFITRGNVLDLAVAVVIGNAFNAITNTLVKNVIMPLIGALTGGANVADWKWVLSEAVYDEAGVLVKAENAVQYGLFVQVIVDFLIIALTIFVALRIVRYFRERLEKIALKAKEGIDNWTNPDGQEEVTDETPQEVVEEVVVETTDDILRDIRDLLKTNAPKSEEDSEA